MWRHLIFLLPCLALAADVNVSFDPYQPSVGPFPSDFLTVPDARQRTGQKVSLPVPDCASRASDCAEIEQLNQLDGFSPNPRLTVRFSGPIDPNTLRTGIFIIYLDQVTMGRYPLEPAGRQIPVNQVIYDPATYTVHAKPDAILEDQRRYLLIVTAAVRDLAGQPVQRDVGFDGCLRQTIGGEYCRSLAAAASALSGLDIRGASLFTTASASAWFEQTHQVIATGPAPVLSGRATVDVSRITSITIREQTGAARFEDFALPIPGSFLAQNGVGRLILGAIDAPNFLDKTYRIAATPTGSGSAPAGESQKLPVHFWLPATAPPPNGYPVLLVLHGLNDSRWGMPTFAAIANNSGYALIVINAVGHGSGPETSLRLTMTDGTLSEFPAPGRGADLDGDGSIQSWEGCVILLPGSPTGLRDCLRQTVADWMSVVRWVQASGDVDGDGRSDLDPASISLLGQSFGGAIGAALTAVEPAVKSAILNVPPGGDTDVYRWSQRLHSSFGIAAVSRRQPSLLNLPNDFDDGFPLRYQPVRIRAVPGAADLQDFFERVEWLGTPGNPTFLAPHLKQATLPGAPIKRVLFQIAVGDKTVPNVSTTALIRAANLREQTSLYRADRAKAAVPSMLDDPHSYLVPLGPTQSLFVSAAAFQQALLFLAAPTESVPDVNYLVRPFFGANLFETPAWLPETP